MNKVKYCDVGIFPIYVGLALTEKAFIAEMKRLKVKYDFPFINEGAGAMMHVLTNPVNNPICIICIDAAKAAKDKIKIEQIAALLAHEAVHVWQTCCDTIGEATCGRETPAYFIQCVTQFCLNQFLNFKPGKAGKPKVRKSASRRKNRK